MKTFADNSARTWAITVNVAAVKRVRELLQVNLLEIADQKGKLLERLVDDPCLLCDILFCLVKPEADAKGISDEDFGRALAGDALGAATDALLAGDRRFFPQGPSRDPPQDPRKADGPARQGDEPGAAEAGRSGTGPADGGGTPKRDGGALRKAGPTTSTSDAGSSPESPASSPADTPSES